MNATQVHIAMRLYILNVFILSADQVHLKKSAQMMNWIGVVKINETIAIRGIINHHQGNSHGKKSYNINIIIGTLSNAEMLNFLHRYVVSFFLFSVSSIFWISSWITHVYQAFSTALINWSCDIFQATLTIACEEEKFTLAFCTPGTFLSDFSMSSAHEEQCIHSISIEIIWEEFLW